MAGGRGGRGGGGRREKGEGIWERRKGYLPLFPSGLFSPRPILPSIDLALQPEGCKGHLDTIIKKVVLVMREKDLICPPPTRKSLALLVAPYISLLHVVFACYTKLQNSPYLCESQEHRCGQTKDLEQARGCKQSVRLGRYSKYTFFHSLYTPQSLSAFAQKSHVGALKKKKKILRKKKTDCFAVYYLVNVKVNF